MAKLLFQRLKDKCKTLDKYVVLLHVGTACGLIGFACTDPLYLRIGSNVSEGAAIAFNLTRLPAPIWTPVYWSAAFMSVNTINIASLLYDRQHIDLEPEEDHLYNRTFRKSGMRPIQFKRLIDAGRIVTFKPSEIIFEEGTVNSTVYLLISGTVVISVKGEYVASLSGEDVGAFLGEMQLLESFMDQNSVHSTMGGQPNKGTAAQGNASTGHYAAKNVLHHKTAEPHVKQNTVSVSQDAPVKAIQWDMEYMLKVLEEQDELAASMRSVLLSTLLKKLRRSSKHQENHNEDYYFSQLEKYLSTGSISALQRNELQQLAMDGFISLKFHYDSLSELGWTEQEYVLGHKLSNTSQTY